MKCAEKIFSRLVCHSVNFVNMILNLARKSIIKERAGFAVVEIMD